MYRPLAGAIHERLKERCLIGDFLTVWFVVIPIDVYRRNRSNLIAHIIERCTYGARSNTVGITGDHADKDSMG